MSKSTTKIIALILAGLMILGTLTGIITTLLH